MAILIDTEEARRKIFSLKDGYLTPMNVQKVIDGIPTVDAVEVVRCKECKFAVMTTDGQLKYCKERDPHCTDKLYYSGDDFCSRGERK